jgi:hypothetical protein
MSVTSTDIVSRLRHWRGLHIAHGGELFESAADEIDRLRNGSAEGCGTVLLTDEEREAIEDAAGICEEHAEEYDGTVISPIAATLRKLLERLA